MNRREFTCALGFSALGIGLAQSLTTSAKVRPEIAITIDDFNWNKSVKLDPDQRNGALLAALRTHGNLKAALFVTCRFADNDKGKELLKEWDRAGHLIGNHSYSHKDLNSSKVTPEEFSADIEKCDELLKSFSRSFKRVSAFRS